MCSLPPFPTLPTISIDPCSLSTGGNVSCPIIFPDVAGLPVWGVQIVLWLMVYVPLTGLMCFFTAVFSLVANALYTFVTGLQADLLSFFTFLASLFAWAGPWAPLLGAAVLGAWLLIVVLVVLFLATLGEDAAKFAVELA